MYIIIAVYYRICIGKLFLKKTYCHFRAIILKRTQVNIFMGHYSLLFFLIDELFLETYLWTCAVMKYLGIFRLNSYCILLTSQIFLGYTYLILCLELIVRVTTSCLNLHFLHYYCNYRTVSHADHCISLKYWLSHHRWTLFVLYKMLFATCWRECCII